MKAFLMYRDRDFDRQGALPWNEQALSLDLGLTVLLEAMALGDKLIFEVARQVILTSLSEVDDIKYRQDILRDCLNNSGVVAELYNLTGEVLERERREYFGLYRSSPGMVLYRSRSVLGMLISMLMRLRGMADAHARTFRSEGFTRLFAMLRSELGDDFFTDAQGHLKRMRFGEGVLLSAGLGKGNKGINHVLHRPPEPRSWREWLFGPKAPGYSFQLHPRDESGARVLSELQDRGVNLVANALAQSVDHILSFFTMLRIELAFYVGCVNLHNQLSKLERPVCFPTPAPADKRLHACRDLYDAGLTLRLKRSVVGNNVDGDDKECMIITGANQGGKSTFLRSIGLAQLMMQSGIFVPAERFCANVCDGIITHFKREEDVTMTSGKLDEELARMSEAVSHMRPNSMILFNESFAATNVREGSEIAGQIVAALLENRIKVFFVTHLYEFAHDLSARKIRGVLFLQAQRLEDGTRTFKLVPGEPRQTSYGEDLYAKIFRGGAPDQGTEIADVGGYDSVAAS